MSSSLHLIAMFTAKRGRTDELRSLLESLVEPTREEAGCLDYRLMADTEDDRKFVFVEEWRDSAALDAHFKMPYLQHALSRFPELLDGELDLRRLKPLK